MLSLKPKQQPFLAPPSLMRCWAGKKVEQDLELELEPELELELELELEPELEPELELEQLQCPADPI
jgi:periplasmic protein TonB